MLKRIPITVVTGFLGSGKTTLLRHLLKSGKQKLAVLVNEFGSVGIDGDLIKSCGFCPENEAEERIFELNNGCLCCTVQDDFLPTMEKLLSSSYQLDGILVETSGLAMPGPLLQALDWPEIRTKVFINGVVTVVNGEAISKGSPVGNLQLLDKQRIEDPSLDHLTPINELFDDQLSAANIVLISRFDLLSKKAIGDVNSQISSKIQPSTSIIPISFGQINPNIILGLKDSDDTLTDSKGKAFPTHNEDHHHHHHVAIKSFVIRLDVYLQKELLEKKLIELAQEHKIVRLKGRCWLPEKAIPLQVQMVGDCLSTWFEESPPTAWKPKNGGIEVIAIGFVDDLDQILKNSLEQIGTSNKN